MPNIDQGINDQIDTKVSIITKIWWWSPGFSGFLAFRFSRKVENTKVYIIENEKILDKGKQSCHRKLILLTLQIRQNWCKKMFRNY